MGVRGKSVVSEKETMMTTNLHRRGGAYYVRVRIPSDVLWMHGDKKEIKYSLRTKDLAEARRRLRIEVVRIQKGFDDLRVGPIEVRALSSRQLRDVPDFQLSQIANLVGANYLSGDSTLRSHLEAPGELAEYKKERTEFRDFLQESLLKKNWEANRQAAASTLMLLNIQFDETEPKFHSFNRALLTAEAKAADAIVARLNDAAAESVPIFSQEEIYRPRLNKKTETLSDIAKTVIQLNPKLASKTKGEKTTIARDFDRFTRDKPVREISRGDCQSFVNFLRDEEQLKPSTISKKIGFLKGLFDYAVDEEWISKNPALRLKLPSPGTEKERVPYSLADLKVIFSSPIFVSGLRQRGGRGEAQVWIPIIALFTGARLEEIAQLNVADIYIDDYDNVWVVRFTNLEEGQSLKTVASRRRIPLHPDLLELGLLEYVESQRVAKHVRLFNLLTPDKHGAFSASFGKWYGRYVRALGIIDTRKVFHSYRHLFKSTLRRGQADDKASRALMGHALSDTSDKYGDESYPLPPMQTALKKLRFPGLVLQKKR